MIVSTQECASGMYGKPNFLTFTHPSVIKVLEKSARNPVQISTFHSLKIHIKPLKALFQKKILQVFLGFSGGEEKRCSPGQAHCKRVCSLCVCVCVGDNDCVFDFTRGERTARQRHIQESSVTRVPSKEGWKLRSSILIKFQHAGI